MTRCLIVGAGSSKPLAHKYTHLFSISANLHFPNANVIFAQDDPILDKILRTDVEGFNTQCVFTTPQKYQKYKDYKKKQGDNTSRHFIVGDISNEFNGII